MTDRTQTAEPAPRRHRWANGDQCLNCGLRREGAGYGPYGSMRYYRDDATGYDYRAPVCVPRDRASAEAEKGTTDANR